ncbi:aminotransferase class I/II-fold pyridoxal phosphate-dependent enzyme [Streptomyces sp. NPDC087856]|uniref:aminotransferase class I/II-fold pyridoxal phosphate-dependent enzyme n=1 Tax=Streptomyces sp. NPDC087856 TaxID=3365811 RepID=UPI0038130FEA
MTRATPRLRPIVKYLASRDALHDGWTGGLPVDHRAHLNESPYPPLPSVVATIRGTADQVNRYPDTGNAELAAAIADRLGVPAAHVTVGPGSTALIHQLFLAAVAPRETVVLTDPCADRYAFLTLLSGARPVQVRLDRGSQDLASMLHAVNRRTRVVVVGNPHDPTGTLVAREHLTELLAALPSDILVVLDETYREFVGTRTTPDGVEAHRLWPNVVAVRSFSAAHGLAGLRVGFALAQPALSTALRSTALPYGTTRLAELAALASLRATAEMSGRIHRLTGERDRLRSALRAQGWTIPHSQANFLWLPLGTRSVAFARACGDQGIAVRVWEGRGVRVTIGDPESNDLIAYVASRFPPAS